MRLFKKKEPPRAPHQNYGPATSLREFDLEGMLGFRVPEHWREELDDECVIFYGDDEPFTLRASVLILTSRNGMGDDPAMEVISMQAQPGERPELLANGNRLNSRRVSGVEQGTSASVYVWELARSFPPNHVRLAVFTLAMPEDAERLQGGRQLASVLDTEIRECKFR
jgi:hypothetical protein